MRIGETGTIVTSIMKCPFCKSENLVLNGHAPNGKQKYLCKTWKRQTRENPTPHAYSEEDREKIRKARIKNGVACVDEKERLE